MKYPSESSVSEPLAGPAIRVAVRTSPSTSVSLASTPLAASTTSGSPTETRNVSATATGASLARTDGDRHDRLGRSCRAVAGGVGKHVRAVEIRARRVRERAIGVQRERAAARHGGQRGQDRIAVRIAVIGQQASRGGDHQRLVLKPGVGVGHGDRCRVEWLTVSVTVAVFDVSRPSVDTYVNTSVPLKSALGVYVNEPSAFSTSVPWEGRLISWAVKASLSGSLSLARMPAAAASVSTASSSTEYASLTAAGEWLADSAMTLIVTVAMLDNAKPSPAW